MKWHDKAYGNLQIYRRHLDVGGDYAYRLRGEDHIWTPDTIARLQHATRSNSWETYETFSRAINEQNQILLTLRGVGRGMLILSEATLALPRMDLFEHAGVLVIDSF